MHLGEVTVGLATFEPGWKWSEHVRPIAGTRAFEVAHLGYCLSGRLHVVMDGGEEKNVGPGEAFSIVPGHDAWVIGKEPCVLLDFAGYNHYAERPSQRPPTRREEHALH